MADIFSTVTAAAALLEQCIKLYIRVREAVERHKDRVDLIDRYTLQVTKTKTIVELVRNENALQTPSIKDSISDIISIGESLRNYLGKISIPRGRVKDFWKQVVSGQEVQNRLDSLMASLENAKLNLSLAMQVTNVGLVKGVGDAVQVSVSAVDAMSQLLQEKLGPSCMLRISQLIEGRSPVGLVTLTKEDIAILATPQLPAKAEGPDAGSRREFVRTVSDNEARTDALQLNTPVGVDVWGGIGRVAIKGNKASDGAIQINAGVDAAAFRDILKLAAQRRGG